MVSVLAWCFVVPLRYQVLHIAAGMLFVLWNSSPIHFAFYCLLVSINILCIRKFNKTTNPLLVLNLTILIVAKAFCSLFEIDISTKTNITVQLILFIPRIFYLSKADPSVKDCLSYTFFLPSILAGPVIPYKRYRHEAIEPNESIARQQISTDRDILRITSVTRIAECLFFMLLMLLIQHKIPQDYLIYEEKSMIKQVILLYVYGLGFRSQYYMIWSFASACYLLCGYNVVNISFIDFELADSIKTCSTYWNTYFSAFLKESVFDLLKHHSVFLASVCTFIASSLMHGGHMCHFMLFVSIGVSIPALRNVKVVTGTFLWPRVARVANTLIISLLISYFSVPFYFLNLKKTMIVWRSVAWYGSGMMVVLYTLYLGNFISSRSRTKKEDPVAQSIEAPANQTPHQEQQDTPVSPAA